MYKIIHIWSINMKKHIWENLCSYKILKIKLKGLFSNFDRWFSFPYLEIEKVLQLHNR